MSVIEEKMGGSAFSVTHDNRAQYQTQAIADSDDTVLATQKAVQNMLGHRWSSFRGVDLGALVDRVRADRSALNDVANTLQHLVNSGQIDQVVASQLMGRVIGEAQYLTEGDLSEAVSSLDHFSDTNVARWSRWAEDRRGASAISTAVRDAAIDGELSSDDLEAVWAAALSHGGVSLWDLSAAFRRLQVMEERGEIDPEQFDALSQQLAGKLVEMGEVDADAIRGGAQDFIASFAKGLASGEGLSLDTADAAAKTVATLLGDDGRVSYGELVGVWRAIHQDDRDLTANEVEQLGKALWDAVAAGELSPADYDRAVRFFNRRIQGVTQGQASTETPFDVLTIDRNGRSYGVSPAVEEVLRKALGDGRLDPSELERALQLAARDRVISDAEIGTILALVEGMSDADLAAATAMLARFVTEQRITQRGADFATPAASNAFYDNGVSFALSAEAREMLITALQREEDAQGLLALIYGDAVDGRGLTPSGEDPRRAAAEVHPSLRGTGDQRTG